MLRTMMKSKIHRATVTQADLHYVGSVTVDEDLLDAADLLPGELVHIVDITNGARLETYTIAGERGSGVIGINGAAARLVHPGDLVILIGYGQMETAEARGAPAARGLRRRRQQDPGDRLRPGRDLRRRPVWSAATAPPGRVACAEWLDAPVRRVPGRLVGARSRLDHDRRRRRHRLRHRRADRGAAAARPGRQGPGRHQGRPRRRLDPVGAGRHRRRARPGGHPRASTSVDTLVAGAGACDLEAVRVLVTEGPEAVRELIALGTNFDHDPDGELSLTREGGHHRDRIAHAGGDATGAEIQRALIAAVEQAPEIEVVQHALAVDLLLARRRRRRLAGVTLHVMGEGQRDGVGAVLCRAVVLASGGLGQVFSQTTNPAVSTGDGMAVALRAGAVLRDLEFVQFHPTVMYLGPDSRGQQPLISEAVRGEGAFLVDFEGSRFMQGVHELADLAPRDVVAKAIMRRMIDDRPPAHVARRPAPRRGVLGASLPDDPGDRPLARRRPGDRPDPGRAGLPLRLRRRAHRPVGPHQRARALRHRRGRLLRRARRQPARLQLAARGPGLLPPDRRRCCPASCGPVACRRRRPPHRGAGARRRAPRAAGGDDRRGSGVLRNADGPRRRRRGCSTSSPAPRADAVDQESWETTNLLTISAALTDAAALREETRGSHWREDFPERDDARCAGHFDVVMDDGATTLRFGPRPATDGPRDERTA